MEEITVLLVEDEPVLASIVKESLEKRGFILHIALNGVEGWSLFKTLKPDICVVDIMMPRKDGYSLVSEIRMIDEVVPILFLTARNEIADVLKGFEVGGDDFMKKPFSMEELILRLKALVRRNISKNTQQSSDSEITIGKYKFRHQLLELLYNSEVAFLSQREADLLLLLLQHKDGLLERRTALIKLWGEDNPFTARSMDVYITRLRKFFKLDSSIQIVNLRGQGYSLIEKNTVH